jgi:uncharacterized membrane protein
MTTATFALEDLLALGASVVLIAAYQVFIRHRSRRDPFYTVQSTNERVRTQWVEGVMGQNKDILGVQTLRNSTMASTFLASTSVVLVIGVLNVVAKGDALASASGPKFLLILLDLFVAFFGFAMSIRLYNHVGYMIGMPAAKEGGSLSPALVARHLNRAATYYHTGMRAFYFLIPLIFWFFGPWALVAASAGLIVLLFSHDRAPRDD